MNGKQCCPIIRKTLVNRSVTDGVEVVGMHMNLFEKTITFRYIKG